MSDQQKQDFKKIIVVLLVLLLLFVAIFFLRFWKKTPLGQNFNPKTSKVVPTTAEILVGKFSLDPAEEKIKAGGQFTLKIAFSAPGKRIDGADVILRFDPQMLQALEATAGTYFSLYPRKEIKKEGTIQVTAFTPSSDKILSESDEILFLTVSFKALKAGVSQITFDYQKGRTNLTTLVESKTSKNILGSVNQAKIIIQ